MARYVPSVGLIFIDESLAIAGSTVPGNQPPGKIAA